MATNRQYEQAQIYNARIVDMRHLWEPSREYQGQPTQKPNYFAVFIVPKTQPHWSQEPIFAGVMQAFGNLWGNSLKAFQQHPQGMGAIQWPIGDGDLPNAQGKSSDYAKGHWIFSASTGSQPNVEICQAGGNPVKLQNKVGVKSGDYCILGVTAAVKANQANGVKFYLNAVVFTSAGPEIVFSGGVSGADLIKGAQAQGMQISGFQPSPGGFPGMGGGAPGFPQPAGFAGAPQPGFGHGGAPGFAPTPAPNAFPQPANPPNYGAPAPGPSGSAFPSSGYQPAPQGAPGFTPPSPSYPAVPTPGTASGSAPGGFAPQPGMPATAFPSNPAPGGWPQR